MERTVTVDKPVGRVWDYMTDFRSTEQWDPPTVRTERTSGDGGVGTTYHNVSSFLGSEQRVTYEVVEHTPPTATTPGRFVLHGDAGSIKLVDTITFTAEAADRTSVTYHAEFVPDGTAAKLAAPVMPVALKVLGDKVAAKLEEELNKLP
ncbi:SRPBCC family protein [Nocardioides sp. CFH 31398]|uniref:SRPBCC family protein n=1 Tax=Nocardioides sp. CFH 31398 TaxID=2919579 RepID=UPI001F06A4A3|nr:SRPBCC family protein [Nocardioides sp. CFH 31398]MCH1865483.1 SRPBCC family protein [Nocardioides sp. CFH 31398]